MNIFLPYPNNIHLSVRSLDDKRLNKQWYIDLTKKRLEQFGGADRGFI